MAHWIPFREARYAFVAMRILLLLAVIAPAIGLSAEVYRWVDDDGVMHYSDRPREGAEVLVIPDAQTFSTPPQNVTRNTPPDDAAAGADGKPFQYGNFAIVSPKPDEVFWNVGGEISVSLSIRPRLRPGHSIFVFLDEQSPRELPRGQAQIQLHDVFRGTHTLHAEVRDTGGQTVGKTGTVQFTVHQTSIQNPNNPNVQPGPRG